MAIRRITYAGSKYMGECLNCDNKQISAYITTRQKDFIRTCSKCGTVHCYHFKDNKVIITDQVYMRLFTDDEASEDEEPGADPDEEAGSARKAGQWIEDEYAYTHCSECGYEWDEPEMKSNFCPQCGARMDGGKSDGED